MKKCSDCERELSFSHKDCRKNVSAFNRAGLFVYDFINQGGWAFCILLGGMGIAISLFAMYYCFEFRWLRFIFFDVPFLLFCGWALYKCVYCTIRDNKDIFKL